VGARAVQYGAVAVAVAAGVAAKGGESDILTSDGTKRQQLQFDVVGQVETPVSGTRFVPER
jgi:hypothetical protein